MASNDVPNQVRVRTDGANSYRYDAIMKASRRFDCNKTRAYRTRVRDGGDLVDNTETALEHEDLPPAVARELAEMISTRHLTAEYKPPSVTMHDDS